MVLLHPLPHDLTAWRPQIASFSERFRTVAIDLPGHGRSPRARPGITLPEVADACWDVADDIAPGEPIVLVGLSVGATVAKYMVNAQPARVSALVLTGGGYHDGPKGIAARHLSAYRERGLVHKREHLVANFAPEFRETETARSCIDLAMERNAAGDTDGTVQLILALDPPDPAWLHPGITVPTLIITGSLDGSIASQRELHQRIARSEHQLIEGAGHCCNIERPLVYDRLVLEFIQRQGALAL